MQWYHLTLITMAVIAGVAAWDVPRAVLWICLGALSYATSAWWHNAGIPGATLFGATTNFIICVFLSWLATTKYEMWVFNCIIMMLVIDALFAAGFIGSRYTFAVSLEIVNAITLILIIATGITDRVARHGHGHSLNVRHRPVADYCHRTLFAERPKHPQWWKHK